MRGKFQSIQLLRAVAALMVVILHSATAFGPEMRGQLASIPFVSTHGWLGVDLFFVISGFIIASVLSKPGVNLATYFWRRFWRIYPLYWIVMCVGLYLYWDRGWWAYSIDDLGTAGMIKSFLIVPQDQQPFWSPGWSLEHEVLFYIIAAIVAPIFGHRALAATMIGLGAVGYFVSGWDYHLFHGAQIEFGAGVLAYLFIGRPWRLAAPIAALAFGSALAVFYRYLALPMPAGMAFFAAGCAATIVALLDLERAGWRVPKSLVLIGDASFSLYLWHWMLLPFFGRWAAAGGSAELWRWKFVALSVVMAIASYLLLERPLVKFSHIKWRQPQILPAA